MFHQDKKKMNAARILFYFFSVSSPKQQQEILLPHLTMWQHVDHTIVKLPFSLVTLTEFLQFESLLSFDNIVQR